jgi:transposase
VIPLEQLERDYVWWVIHHHCGGDKPEAAKRMGISLRTIYNLFKDF